MSSLLGRDLLAAAALGDLERLQRVYAIDPDQSLMLIRSRRVDVLRAAIECGRVEVLEWLLARVDGDATASAAPAPPPPPPPPPTPSTPPPSSATEEPKRKATKNPKKRKKARKTKGRKTKPGKNKTKKKSKKRKDRSRPLLLKAALSVRAADMALLLVRRGGAELEEHAKALLILACEADLPEVVEAMLERMGSTVEKATLNEAMVAVCSSGVGRVEVARMLLEAGAEVGAGATLHLACRSHHASLVRVLVEHGADVNETAAVASTLRPLSVACDCCDVEVARILLGAGAKIEAVDLQAAVKHEDPALLRMLLAAAPSDGEAFASDTCHRLHMLCAAGLTDEACALLSDEALALNLDAVDSSSSTALHVACRKRQADVVQLLLQRGAQPGLHTNKHLYSPLHIACMDANPVLAIVSALLDAGATTADADCDGYTALHHACTHLADEVVQLLVDHGAPVGAAATAGFTPLHAVCSAGGTAAARILLEHGAKLDAVTVYEGDMLLPVQIACKCGRAELLELLLAHGGEIDELALKLACDGESAEVVQVAARHGAPVDAIFSGKTAVARMCELNSIPAVQALLDAGANAGLTWGVQRQPLAIACASGNDELVRLLLGQPNVFANSVSADGETPLTEACTHGHRAVVKTLLESGANPNAVALGGSPVLHLVAESGDAQLAQLLVDAGSFVNAADLSGRTALLCACDQGHANMTRVLLDSGANPNARTFKGQTPLRAACASNNVEIVGLLLDAGATAHDRDGPPPIVVASQAGALEVVRLLLKVSADGTDDVADLLAAAVDEAVNCGNTEICHELIAAGAVPREDSLVRAMSTTAGEALVRLLLKEGGMSPDVGAANGFSALALACTGGAVEIAGALLDAGASLTPLPDGTPLLCVSCERGRAPLLRLLLAAGADANEPDPTGQLPLSMACEVGDADVVQALLEGGAHANGVPSDSATVKSPLLTACSSRLARLGVVKQLLEAGADPNLFANDGSSPLSAACYRGDLDMVRILIDAGASVPLMYECTPHSVTWVCSKDGRLELLELLLQSGLSEPSYLDEPLLVAARDGSTQVVQTLIKHGARVNCVRNGFTPLQQACEIVGSRATAVVKLLLSAGADPNLPHNNGGLLASVVKNARGDLVKVLLAAGCDPNTPDSDGRSPLQIACLAKHAAVVRRLLRAGADARFVLPSGQTLLHVVCNMRPMSKKSSVRVMIRALVRYGADEGALDSAGRAPAQNTRRKTVKRTLRRAVRRARNRRVTQLLLGVRAGLQPPRSETDSTPLHRAVRHCTFDINLLGMITSFVTGRESGKFMTIAHDGDQESEDDDDDDDEDEEEDDDDDDDVAA